MELYYILTVLDRQKRSLQEKIFQELHLNCALTMMGRGTATMQHLSMRGLSPTEKAVTAAVADQEAAKKLFQMTRQKLYIDIPGNGIMAAIPVKSVGGMQTLAQLTDQKPGSTGKPEMKFDHELICVILNEGYSDDVMDAAREAGATGGTVISAKGTGILPSAKFNGMSIAGEREMLLILSRAEQKADIMKAVIGKTGVNTPAGAICFSLPVSYAEGFRKTEPNAL